MQIVTLRRTEHLTEENLRDIQESRANSASEASAAVNNNPLANLLGGQNFEKSRHVQITNVRFHLSNKSTNLCIINGSSRWIFSSYFLLFILAFNSLGMYFLGVTELETLRTSKSFVNPLVHHSMVLLLLPSANS